MKISQRSVEALKPPAKGSHSKVWYDDKATGFGVRVSEAGVKAFVLNYSVAGRERRATIGRWPEWSADAAREEARNLIRGSFGQRSSIPHLRRSLRYGEHFQSNQP